MAIAQRSARWIFLVGLLSMGALQPCAARAESDSEYEQLAHLLLSDSATERSQGAALLRQYIQQSSDNDTVMERILHALRAWANDPLRLAFDSHTPFDHADRWRAALLDAQPRSLRPSHSNPRGSDPKRSPAGVGTDGHSSMEPKPGGTERARPKPTTSDAASEEAKHVDSKRVEEVLQSRRYRLHIDMLETLSERFKPIRRDRSGRWLLGIIVATETRHREIAAALDADTRNRLASVPDDVSRVPPPPLDIEAPLDESGERVEPNWNVLYPHLRGEAFDVGVSLIDVPEAAATLFAEEHGASGDPTTAASLSSRDVLARWLNEAKAIDSASVLIAAHGDTIVGGRPMDVHAGTPVTYNRRLVRAKQGSGWTIATGSIADGYTVRVQLMDVGKSSIRVRVRIRHVHTPMPLPSIDVSPSESGRTYELHQPQWSTRERERELTLPRTGTSALMILPTLKPVPAKRALLLIVDIAPGRTPSTKTLPKSVPSPNERPAKSKR